jgi:XapX domain-containing protein
MTEIIFSLAVGLVIGIIFTALKLPIPAPPVLAGIMGIVGIYCGNQLYLKILTLF